MKLIVGLGNPGEKYVDTRHNIGFMVVEKFVKHQTSSLQTPKAWQTEEKFHAEVCKLDHCIVAKPQTFMNLSGESVAKLAAFYKIEPSDIWVIHDDIDLPLAKIRIRMGGASAGHRGVQSIIDTLGTSDFLRLRLGVGRGKLDVHKTADQNLPRQGVEKYVVSPFTESEAGDLKKLLNHTVEALETLLEKGIEKTMNQYN